MMTRVEDRLVKTSKLLSYVLRHRPDSVGMTLGEGGWVELQLLIDRCRAFGHPLTREMVLEAVAQNSKQRFALSPDGHRIRASQGHSVDVDLGYQAAVPPDELFHGTIAAVLQAILADGLSKMQRHHVHLSADVETARTVATRRGKPVILRVAAARMHADKHAFFLSDNGVWLTDHVPARYLSRA